MADDECRSGRLLVNDNVEDRIKDVLEFDKYSTNIRTSCNTAEEVSVSHTPILRHFNKMGKEYLANRSLPHLLFDESKANRERIWGEFFALYG